MLGDNHALSTISLESVVDSQDQWGRTGLTLDLRYILLPKANLIVQLASIRDQLILTQFDVAEALANFNIEYLFIESRPPTEISAGETFQYQIKAQSSSGDLKYSSESAPKGMKVSPSGLMTWTTSTGSPPANSIIVTVSDKTGQEVFHVFDLKVRGGTGTDSVASSNVAFSEDVDVSIVEAPIGEREKEKKHQTARHIGQHDCRWWWAFCFGASEAPQVNWCVRCRSGKIHQVLTGDRRSNAHRRRCQPCSCDQPGPGGDVALQPDYPGT